MPTLEKIGRYEIIGELGKGAMGVVYKATDPNIGRTLAIKTLRLDAHGDSEERLVRFRNEARAVGGMNHANIVTIYDAGEYEGLFYIAMEYIQGHTLQEILRSGQRPNVDTMCAIGRQVCAGLDYAHARGIIHRDIKPANIMLTADGTVKIMDFGIAKGGGTGQTTTGQVVGTPNYMSPEQVRGLTIDGRSDLFSLGVVLYEILTGSRPFGGENVTTIIYKIVNETPLAPCGIRTSIHPGLSAVVMKALSKTPEERFPTGAEFAQALHDFQNFAAQAPPLSTPTAVTLASAARPASEPSAPILSVATAGLETGLKLAPLNSAMDTTVSAPPALVAPPARVPAKNNPIALMAVIAVMIITSVIGIVRLRRASQGLVALEPSEAQADPSAGRASPATTPRSEGVGHARPLPATSSALGAVQISSTPFGAKVTIDGKSDPDWQTPFAATRLRPGRHSVSFSLKGYQTETRQVEVIAGDKVPLVVKLQVAQGFLALGSDPPGAAIYVDGVDSGQLTPARITVNEGRHRIALRKPGYKPQITYADVAAGQSFNFAPALLGGPVPVASEAGPFRKLKRLFAKSPAEDGTLEVRTRPRGAEIRLGSAAAPSRTPARLAVAPGSYTLTLSLPGYKPIIRSIQIEKGKLLGVDEIFEPQ